MGNGYWRGLEHRYGPEGSRIIGGRDHYQYRTSKSSVTNASSGSPETEATMESFRNQNHHQPYSDEHLYVDLRRELVTLDHQVLALTHKEYCLLLLLVQHAGETLSRET